MTVGYVLTEATEADLRDIIRYTRNAWGDPQARRYLAKLERGIERAASGQGMFADMATLHPDLRMVRCEHHYVFFLPRADAPTLIVAILHERMDLMAWLTRRLDEGA